MLRTILTAGILWGLALPAFCQGIVSSKPERPELSRPIQPCSNGEIWIQGEWVWNQDRQAYTWKPGRCDKGPRNHTYVPGYWKRMEDGWSWVAGSWEKISEEGIRRSRRP